jgi:MFS family permease
MIEGRGLRGQPGRIDWARNAPALRFRNFRLFWLGQIVSNLGTAIQVVAEGWLVYDLTESTFWLGMVGFLALLPVIPISLFGGVLIDRFPRRKVILVTQVGLMLQAAVFGLLAMTGQLTVSTIVLLYFVFGALLAIDHPARRAFVVELVDRDSLANAVALNGAIFNFASLVGYALSGLLIAAIGAGGTMLVNSATYLAPMAALLLIRLPDVRHDVGGQPLRSAWLEGFRALLADRTMVATIGLMAVVGGLAWPVYGMMPAFAEEVLNTGAIGLGLLLAAAALGAVIGTLVVARLKSHGRGRFLAVTSLALPVLLIVFSRSTSMVMACASLVGVGMTLLIVQSLAITLVQVNVADRVRGRVMTVYSQVHAGSDTLSNVAIGTLAVRTGLPTALALGGVLALAAAAGLLALVPGVRRLE